MAKLTDYLGHPHSGIVSHAVVGIVVDNVDEDELGRVQVKFPTLQEEPNSFWLRVATPNGGKERGFYALPEVDDEVLVLFMQGSQDVGVIIGQFWNGQDKPVKEAKDGMPGASGLGGSLCGTKPQDGSTTIDANDRRIWRSRSGHLLVFDDSDGKESVQIWDKSHKLALVFDTAGGGIVLSNTNAAISIHAKGDLTLEAEKNIKMKAGEKIEVESGQDTTFKAGTNFKAEASGGNFEAKASADVKIQASVNLDAKGTNVKLEGSAELKAKGGASATYEGGGTCTVKGAMVKIN